MLNEMSREYEEISNLRDKESTESRETESEGLAIEFQEYNFRVTRNQIVDYWLGAVEGLKSSKELFQLRLQGAFFSDEEVDQLYSLAQSQDEPSSNKRLTQLIESVLKREESFARERQKDSEEFIRNNYKQLITFLHLPNPIGRKFKFSYVPFVLREPERHILKEFGAEAGRYVRERSEAFTLTSSLLTDKTPADYIRTSTHEFFHFLSDSGNKVGFRVGYLDEEEGQTSTLELNETITEYIVKKYFTSNHPEMNITFNEDYLETASMAEALEKIAGWEALIEAYVQPEGAERILESLNKQNRAGVAFTFPLLEHIQLTVGRFLDSDTTARLLLGDDVIVNLKDPALRDINEDKLRLLTKVLTNVHIEE